MTKKDLSKAIAVFLSLVIIVSNSTVPTFSYEPQIADVIGSDLIKQDLTDGEEDCRGDDSFKMLSEDLNS